MIKETVKTIDALNKYIRHSSNAKLFASRTQANRIKQSLMMSPKERSIADYSMQKSTLNDTSCMTPQEESIADQWRRLEQDYFPPEILIQSPEQMKQRFQEMKIKLSRRSVVPSFYEKPTDNGNLSFIKVAVKPREGA